MSPFTSKLWRFQHRSQQEAHTSRCKHSTAYALIFSGFSMALVGCQTSSNLSSSANPSQPLMDFNITDIAKNQAQGRAFNSRLNADTEDYQQVFNSAQYPNNDTQAKQRLLAAIRQHLATEHVSVTQARYHAAPFIKPDSIDAGSTGLLQTLINLYAYKQAERADSDDDGNYDDNDYSDDSEMEAEDTEEVLVEDIDSTDVDLADGENDDDSLEAEGDDEYSSEDEYEYEEDEEEYSSGGLGGLLSITRGLNIRELFDNYEAMQAKNEQVINKQSQTGVIGQILSMLSQTPEQIEAVNTYQYQYFSVNSVSKYQPQDKRIQSVYSYDYLAPTITSSLQVPIALDFNNSRVTIDPSALMPIMALTSPENTPLPTEMTAHTVDFGLPDAITSQIPSAVIYDAVIDAVQNSMAELAPDYFSAIDIRDDQFAKEVGAVRAVKVYFGSQQSGELIGKVFKYTSRSLQKYIDAHPDKYAEDATLKMAITKIEQYNKGYQSADVGSLLQLIEAIGPISFNHTNYYYLDASDRLLAKQQRINIGGDLLGSENTVVNQTRYDSASFNKHPLAALLAQSFRADAPPAIDGNAWIKKMQQQKERMQQASDVRYDYDDGNSDDSDYSDTNNSDSNNDDYDYDGLDIENETDNMTDAQ